MFKKNSNKNSPLTLTNGRFTQNFEVVIDNRLDFVLLSNGEKATTSSVNVNVANDKLRMSTWTFDSTLRLGGKMTVTSEALDVINNSEVKVILHGVVLDAIGKERNSDALRAELSLSILIRDFLILDSKEGVIKKHGILNLVLGTRVERFGRPGSRVISLTNNTANFLFRDMVTARLCLKIEYLDRTISKREVAIKRFSEKSFLDLSQTMKKLLASPGFTNAKIVCGDDVEIAVNKEILASRSPVFETMFRTDMKEATIRVVQVTDIRGKSMKVLVEFLTSGKLDQSWNAPNVLTDLGRAVDKYGIESLRSFIDDWFEEEDVVRSTLELLNMAADCGYPKAELKIAKNVGSLAKRLKTRDNFLLAIGINAEAMDERTKEWMKSRLLRWIDADLDRPHHCLLLESSLKLVNIAADLGLRVIERRLMEDLGKRLESARSRDEVLKVLGIPKQE